MSTKNTVESLTQTPNEKIQLVRCNKGEPKSDWDGTNIYPEGELSDGTFFINQGEVMQLYNAKRQYSRTLYHTSALKKQIEDQYEAWEPIPKSDERYVPWESLMNQEN